MRETLECSSGSVDWITAVVTVGSKLWELEGAVHWSTVTQHEGRGPLQCSRTPFLQIRGGPCGLMRNELYDVSSLTFPKAGVGGGRGPFQLVYAKQDKIKQQPILCNGKFSIWGRLQEPHWGALHHSPASMWASFLGSMWQQKDY